MPETTASTCALVNMAWALSKDCSLTQDDDPLSWLHSTPFACRVRGDASTHEWASLESKYQYKLHSLLSEPGLTSSSLTPSGSLVLYLPSARAYSWNVPGWLRPAFRCLGQWHSSVPLVQYSHSPQVL